MNKLAMQLARQATRTTVNKTVRKSAKSLDIPPVVKHVGLAAILAGISYVITQKMK